MQHPFHPSRIQHTSCNFLGEKTQSNPPQKDGSGSSGCRGAPPGARAFAPAKLCRINGQSCMWQSCGWKMVWDRNGVWQSCGRKMLFVCQRWCMAKLGMTKCMWQRCVRKRVCVCVFVWQRYDRSSGGPDRRKLCVKICCGTKNVWQTKCVTKLREKKRWDKDGVWLRWRLTKIT